MEIEKIVRPILDEAAAQILRRCPTVTHVLIDFDLATDRGRTMDKVFMPRKLGALGNRYRGR